MANFYKKIVIVTVIGIIFGCASQESNQLIDNDLSLFSNQFTFGDAQVENGTLVLESTDNWFFTTKKRYTNFILTADVLMPDVKEYSNSGILFRARTEKQNGKTVVIGYQAEIDPSDRKWSGGIFEQGGRKWLYPEHPTKTNRDNDFIRSELPKWNDTQRNAYRHLSWNRYTIDCRNDEIKIFVNGILTSHIIDNKLQTGVIGFQHHGSKKLRETGETDNIVRFKNITITELP